MTIPDNPLGLDGFEYVEFPGPNPEALAGPFTAMVPTADIFATVDAMRTNGIRFQDSPDTYYDMIDERLPGHGDDVEEMHKRRTLIDGSPETGEGPLPQIFTENMIGPIFFEFIQRKGNRGFGEGNFKALFESIELHQIRRGVIPAAAEHDGRS